MRGGVCIDGRMRGGACLFWSFCAWRVRELVGFCARPIDWRPGTRKLSRGRAGTRRGPAVESLGRAYRWPLGTWIFLRGLIYPSARPSRPIVPALYIRGRNRYPHRTRGRESNPSQIPYTCSGYVIDR